MSFLLTTPEQHDFQDPTLELNEKKLKLWLDGLPALDNGEALRQVLGALEALNEQRLPAERRLLLMQQYLPVYRRLYAAFEPQNLRQQQVADAQRQVLVDRFEQLSLAMANAFKLIAKAFHSGAEPCDKETFGRVLRWTLQSLSATLLHSYRCYRPEPGFVFLEMNQVYRLARHRGLQELAGEGEHGQLSLARYYQAICLLSLCDPFSLPEGVAEHCYRTLLGYPGGTRIIPGNTWQGFPEGLYFLDLQSDNRPRHCVQLTSPVDGDDPHLLDARGLLQQMHKTLATLPVERRRSSDEAVILKALLPEVSAGEQRTEARHPDERHVGLVHGLEAVSACLAARQEGRAPRFEDWRVKDVSEGGYCLSADPVTAAVALVPVGELVCVVAETPSSTGSGLQLAVVRWIRDQREQGAELGLERIPGSPGRVQVSVDGDADAERLPAVFLPSDGAQGTAARLITPLEVYAENRPLLLYVGEREVAIRCGPLVEQTAAFDCFELASS